MRSEAERLAERVTRLERIVLALIDADMDGNNKSATYYFEQSDVVSRFIEEELHFMREDMRRSDSTGQV